MVGKFIIFKNTISLKPLPGNHLKKINQAKQKEPRTRLAFGRNND
jgi:hypothetical protein